MPKKDKKDQHPLIGKQVRITMGETVLAGTCTAVAANDAVTVLQGDGKYLVAPISKVSLAAT